MTSPKYQIGDRIYLPAIDDEPESWGVVVEIVECLGDYIYNVRPDGAGEGVLWTCDEDGMPT